MPEDRNAQIRQLRTQLEEALETLRAIRTGEVDALVVLGPQGEQVYTLKGAEEPYRAMVETMAEGAITLSPDGTILYCNARFAEMVKLPLEQTIGSSARRFIAQNDMPAYDHMLARSRDEPLRGELDMVAADGSRMPVHFSTRILRGEKLDAIAAVITDLSEIARLKELDRLKSMFIASMSHELRTPLHSIIGFTGFLLQGVAGGINEEQRKQLGIVKRSADHLLALVNDIMDVAKIAADRAEFTIAPVDLGELVRDVASSFVASVQEKELELRVLGEHTVTIHSDRKRLRQALVNLVDNAVKFTDRGFVEIRLESAGDSASIAVSDTGVGLSADDMPKLFQPFSQIAIAGRSTEGTGLGLYLCRKIAEMLGGGIDVASQPGTGSTFTLRLPASPAS